MKVFLDSALLLEVKEQFSKLMKLITVLLELKLIVGEPILAEGILNV